MQSFLHTVGAIYGNAAQVALDIALDDETEVTWENRLRFAREGRILDQAAQAIAFAQTY